MDKRSIARGAAARQDGLETPLLPLREPQFPLQERHRPPQERADRRVVAVIPAYNEEQTVGAVVRAVRALDAVSRVLVVSDGSTDGTARAAREAGADCLELSTNRGKGAALQAGLEAASDAEVYLLLDADLLGLKPEHAEALLEPVLRGRADCSLGLFLGGRLNTDLAHRVAPFLTGQRAVRRAALRGLPPLADSRFGVEVVLTRHFRRRGARIVRVPLAGVTHRTKEEKLGLWRGTRARWAMYREILAAVPVLRQVFTLGEILTLHRPILRPRQAGLWLGTALALILLIRSRPLHLSLVRPHEALEIPAAPAAVLSTDAVGERLASGPLGGAEVGVAEAGTAEAAGRAGAAGVAGAAGAVDAADAANAAEAVAAADDAMEAAGSADAAEAAATASREFQEPGL